MFGVAGPHPPRRFVPINSSGIKIYGGRALASFAARRYRRAHAHACHEIKSHDAAALGLGWGGMLESKVLVFRSLTQDLAKRFLRR